MKVVGFIRFLHFRRDGSRWIVDIEFENNTKWLGWFEGKTKKSAIQNIVAVTGHTPVFASDGRTAWL